MNKMLLEEIVPILPLDQEDCRKFAAAVQDRFNNPFVNHELMSISLNSTSKWRARNMPSFLEYVQTKGQLPKCLTMSFAAYIAFFSNDIQELTDAGLVCRRPKGNTYVCSDDRWALEFYYDHRNDSVYLPGKFRSLSCFIKGKISTGIQTLDFTRVHSHSCPKSR